MMVNLEDGMFGIRRDGVRVGPIEQIRRVLGTEPMFAASTAAYMQDGTAAHGCHDMQPIIAAGHPWVTLGAKVGDKVSRIWCGYENRQTLHNVWKVGGKHDTGKLHPDSLYIITARAKDTTRPRAAHKMNLQPGDVVRLVAWECDCTDEYAVGEEFTFPNRILERDEKGHRPLFTVISRAAKL